jgi:hypothetical protein
MSTTQNADLTIGYVSFLAPLGSVVDHITVVAVATNTANNPPPQSVPPGTTAVAFIDLVPDTYTFSAQAFPATGTGFGTPVSVTLAITSTSVTLQIPGDITAVQP